MFWPSGGSANLYRRAIRPTALGLDELVWGCFVSPGSTLICRREVFDEVGVFDTTLPRLEDWDWLLRYVARYPLGFLAEPLARDRAILRRSCGAGVPALDILEARYGAQFSGRHRRQFAAALEFERAASHYRSGDRVFRIHVSGEFAASRAISSRCIGGDAAQPFWRGLIVDVRHRGNLATIRRSSASTHCASARHDNGDRLSRAGRRRPLGRR